MGSVGDESHDAVAKDLAEECHELKAEVHEVHEVDEGLATQKVIVVEEAHKSEVHEAEVLEAVILEADVHKAEGLATQNPSEVQEAQKAAVQEVAIQEAEVQEADAQEADAQEADGHESDMHETEVHETDVHEAVDPATPNPSGVEEAHEEHVVDEISQKFSVVMIAGIDDRDKVDPVPMGEPETHASVQEVVPAVKRKLPEVKRFSARRSVVVEDPSTVGSDESMAPSTMRRLRSARKHSARMNTGIDDRDTVDYTVENPKPVVKNDALAVVKESVSAAKQQLTVAERERLRLSCIKRKKDFASWEKIRGNSVNITEGLELHTGVFSRVEQNRLIDLVKELQARGRRQDLKEKTYSEPRKWMRGKGRVTLQFGCCYNYAIDKAGNPPGILREDVVDPIPPLLRTTIKRLVRWHVLPPSCVPDSCIINIYEEGDCIPPHIDHHDFLRPFCTLSLVSECSIVFGANLEILGPGNFGGSISIPLPMGSVLVLNGNGADVAKHAVPAVPTERISITFRKMDPSKVPSGFTLDQELQNLTPVSLPS